MGAVYRARQKGLNRMVAVKVLLGGRFANPAFIQRFRREAEAAASLSHPNIVAIHEVGEHEGQPYFSMELVEGRSLAELMRGPPPPARQAAVWVKTIAEAVHYAHEHGVLHRDLKPSNVLVDAQGAPHVTDFGLAKFVAQVFQPAVSPACSRQTPGQSEALEKGGEHAGCKPALRQTGCLRYEQDLTLTGQVLGSPNYMPPEQADPKHGPATAASDVYSLGAILYHLLTGRPPFLAETVTQTLRMVTDGELAPPRLLQSSLSRDLETVCLKCLEADPRRRYATALELAGELGRFLNDEPIRARPIGALGRLARWRRRKPALAASLGAGASLLLVVLIGLPVATWRIDAERRQAEAAREQEAALRVRAESAERATESQLYVALLEQARATVLSGKMGHRVDALDALRRAAAISNTVELRREVFAALALPDVRFERALPHGGRVMLDRVDPAFQRIAVCPGKGPVEIRSVADDRLLATLPASTNLPVHVALWSQDGRFLVVKRDRDGAGYRAEWEVWDLRPPSPQPSPPAEGTRLVMVIRDATLNAVALHPREARLAAGLEGKAVAIWDLNTGAELIRHRLEGQPFLLKLWGERFAVAQRTTTGALFSVHRAMDGGTLASQPIRNTMTDIEWHPGGSWIAVTDISGAVHLADAQTGAFHELGRHKENASYARFSPDGSWLVSSGWDREFICWDMRAMRRAFTMALDSFVWQFRSDGRACAVQTRTEVRLHAFEQPAGHRDFAEDLGGHASRAAFSPDGRWLAASGVRRAGVWDLRATGPAALVEEGGDTHMAFSAAGELFAGRRGAAFRWKVAPATNGSLAPRLERQRFAAPSDVIYLSLATNGVVLTGQRGSRLAPFDQLESGGKPWVRTADGPNGLSPDGRWLGVFRSFTPHLYVHQMPEMTRVAKLTQAGNIGNFQFSPAGDEVAVYSRAGVEFWSTADWRRTRARTNFTDFRQFLHAPDGRTCWMATDHRTGGLYRTDTLELLLPLPHGMAPLAVSPDGRHFAVSVDAQRLRVWDLAEVRRQLRELGMDWE
jgi:hypothetical protein